MSVRSAAAWLSAVLTVAAGTSVAAAGPPPPERNDRVTLGLPNRFHAGGSAREVTVTLAKRTDGCASVRTMLLFRMPDLAPDQLDVQVESDGRRQRLPVTRGPDDLLLTDRVTPDEPRVCRPRSEEVRYRVAFQPSAPGGRVTIIARVSTADGDRMGRATGTRQVIRNQRPVPPSPSPSPTPSPSPSPSPSPTPSPADTHRDRPASVHIVRPGG